MDGRLALKALQWIPADLSRSTVCHFSILDLPAHSLQSRDGAPAPRDGTRLQGVVYVVGSRACLMINLRHARVLVQLLRQRHRHSIRLYIKTPKSITIKTQVQGPHPPSCRPANPPPAHLSSLSFLPPSFHSPQCWQVGSRSRGFKPACYRAPLSFAALLIRVRVCECACIHALAQNV
jgi:hypothetical protein